MWARPNAPLLHWCDEQKWQNLTISSENGDCHQSNGELFTNFACQRCAHKDMLLARSFPQWEKIRGTVKERWWDADTVGMYVFVRESTEWDSVFSDTQKIRERISCRILSISYQITLRLPASHTWLLSCKIPFMESIHTFLTLIPAWFGSSV